QEGNVFDEPYTFPPAPEPPAGPVTVQILRTLCANRFAKAQARAEGGLRDLCEPAIINGEDGIRQAYLAAIEKATRFIYLENQHAVSTEILKALISRLKDDTAPVELILVMNNYADIPLYSTFLPLPSELDVWVGVVIALLAPVTVPILLLLNLLEFLF